MLRWLYARSVLTLGLARPPAVCVLKVTRVQLANIQPPFLEVNTPWKVLLPAQIVLMGTLVTRQVKSHRVNLVKCACGATTLSQPEEDLAMPVTTVTTV